MELIILAASGRTGLELVRQALERGHTVTAIARDSGRIAVAGDPALRKVTADVTDAAGLAAVVNQGSLVLSALGTDRAGVLAAGADALVAAGPQRTIWLGAYGTGGSAGSAGEAARHLESMLGDRLADKVAADRTILAHGGTVFHARLLSDGPPSPDRRTVGLSDAPPLDFSGKITRATVAAAMLDEAERPRFRGAIAVPLPS
jgi:nucleoside-diphosphate-sugar epimerase